MCWVTLTTLSVRRFSTWTSGVMSSRRIRERCLKLFWLWILRLLLFRLISFRSWLIWQLWNYNNHKNAKCQNKKLTSNYRRQSLGLKSNAVKLMFKERNQVSISSIQTCKKKVMTSSAQLILTNVFCLRFLHVWVWVFTPLSCTLMMALNHLF